MKTLADCFYDTAFEHAERIAVCCDDERITYGQLADLVSQYSNFLLENGIVYGDRIGIPMNNSILSVALIFAAANIGVALVPINPTLPFEAMVSAFEAADVKHLIAREHFLSQHDVNNHLNIQGVVISMDAPYKDSYLLQEAHEMSKDRPSNEKISGEEVLIITMTSGSTGKPKPIALTQNNKYRRALAHIRLYGITSQDKVLAATPLYHSLAERLVIIPLLLGGTSVLLPRFTSALWVECVKTNQVTFSIAVSAQLNQIYNYLLQHDDKHIEIQSLRSLVSSSALLDSTIKNKLIPMLNCDFHEMYGTSETSTATSIHFKESMHKKKSVGKPLSGVSLIILDEHENECEPYTIGEIACSTELLCHSYYNMPQTFEESFFKNYFKTGDVGYLDDEGYLYFAGRKKEVIITGGINVYPQDIEECVNRVDAVSESAAFSSPSMRLGEVVGLAIVLKEGRELSEKEVRSHCAKNLADFQQPHEIVFLNDLPKNSMGKLVRSELATRK
ncbi:hypothetical protein CDO73_21875 [Saccharibacillus sp. O23]|uniref:class I adenylate-forming enzyme family protein n=1 Tax=Saccharibacillus sp. O23 TaxID=2009338 RepID=UPI000B4E497D|nr:class I adenylate-forming enzyme family protein [Saccharibacillus sp. O23]OWR27586.1 hypothetical protein CDO73_21875 [Saccharibacillus sp. O23]